MSLYRDNTALSRIIGWSTAVSSVIYFWGAVLLGAIILEADRGARGMLVLICAQGFIIGAFKVKLGADFLKMTLNNVTAQLVFIGMLEFAFSFYYLSVIMSGYLFLAYFLILYGMPFLYVNILAWRKKAGSPGF